MYTEKARTKPFLITWTVSKISKMKMSCEDLGQWCVRVHGWRDQYVVHVISAQYKRKWRLLNKTTGHSAAGGSAVCSQGLCNWEYWTGAPDWPSFLNSTLQRTRKDTKQVLSMQSLTWHYLHDIVSLPSAPPLKQWQKNINSGEQNLILKWFRKEHSTQYVQ